MPPENCRVQLCKYLQAVNDPEPLAYQKHFADL